MCHLAVTITVHNEVADIIGFCDTKITAEEASPAILAFFDDKSFARSVEIGVETFRCHCCTIQVLGGGWNSNLARLT